jgi:hypothetical protein
VLTGGTAFQRFPIPVVEGQTAFGLALVATATWLSVWLDGRQTTPRQAVSFVYSAIAVLFVMVSLVSVVDLSRHVVVEPFYSDQLIDSEGVPIVNIYAYDLDGNPVEVLLFDQDGSPLLNLPDWAYHEAEQNPGRTGPIDFGDGAVEFRTDEFGRVIPNLYPLDLYSYGVYGLEPTDPPGLRSTEPEAVDEQGTIVTTTMIGQVD